MKLKKKPKFEIKNLKNFKDQNKKNLWHFIVHYYNKTPNLLVLLMDI